MPAGEDMIDMPQRGLSRSAQATANRRVADDFLDLAFNQRDMTSARKLLAADFRHHEPTVPSGAAGFLAHLAESFSRPAFRLEPVRHICDGDFVVVHSRCSDAENTMAVIDILRIEYGRISEFWHVFQPVPEIIANPNGMF